MSTSNNNTNSQISLSSATSSNPTNVNVSSTLGSMLNQTSQQMSQQSSNNNMNNMNNMNNNNNTASTSQHQAEVDINILLTQLKNMEGDREKLLQQVQVLQEKIGKLTEGKKAEMQKALDTVIKNWVEQSVQDETVKTEFMKGMSRLVDQTAEESGVWRVVCCASQLHAKQLEEKERLLNELNRIKQGLGSFHAEESRKRSIDDVIGSSETSNEPRRDMNIWEQFAENMKGRTWEPGL